MKRGRREKAWGGQRQAAERMRRSAEQREGQSQQMTMMAQ